MDGSTDLIKARVVAKHIGSIHHEVIVTAEDMLSAIKTVIQQTETYDTTTVRASTPMYLLSKYIKDNTDIVVVFSGEGSDEASGSYMYFHNAPSHNEFQDECVRLLQDLCYFDCLRCDKATAGNGLEVRVPFLDKEFLTEYMRVPVEWKVPKDGMEKWFIRKAFDGTGLLPDEILWRKKEAFSDGVSSTEKSWYQIIQEHINEIVTDTEFEEQKNSFDVNPPFLKESYYYRKVFEEYYPGRGSTIPYYWLPKWSGDTKDPSARVLNVYNKSDQL
jgi:asparagine synthase (glutamine-hydrolysing)